MIEIVASKYKCPACGSASFAASSTQWTCRECAHDFACIAGMPKLFLEEKLGAQDRKLRETLYDGIFGRFYQLTMPLIVMPVRPLSMSWPHWLAYGLTLLVLAGLVATLLGGGPFAILALLLLAATAWFLSQQRYLLHLFYLAAPVWFSLSRQPYAPPESFAQVHERVLAPLRAAGRRLQVLDVSTGSCNSLFKHGWMTLDADYTAIDLSETMLKQGSEMMARNGAPVDLVIGDAMELPFQSDSFDVVLSYGAVNGLTEPAKAIAEMARVAKPGGVLLFLDEQLFEAATPVQRRYFQTVLSSHNVIHHCPVEAFPKSLTDVRVSQVYQFYYICTALKRGARTPGSRTSPRRRAKSG